MPRSDEGNGMFPSQRPRSAAFEESIRSCLIEVLEPRRFLSVAPLGDSTTFLLPSRFRPTPAFSAAGASTGRIDADCPPVITTRSIATFSNGGIREAFGAFPERQD